jgi:hypothetical protein
MRYLAVLAMLLSGCAYNATLHERGSNMTASGTFEVGSQTLSVELDGGTYRGDVIAGTSAGFGLVGARPVTMMGATNQRSALLVGPKGVLRCEYMIQVSGGNGVCQHGDGRVFDLLLKP